MVVKAVNIACNNGLDEFVRCNGKLFTVEKLKCCLPDTSSLDNTKTLDTDWNAL